MLTNLQHFAGASKVVTAATRNPYVLVDIANDNPHRGDVRAVRGIAKAIAQKQGWEIHFLDSQTPYPKPLTSKFLDSLNIGIKRRPDVEDMRNDKFGSLWPREIDHVERIKSHIKQHGSPEIVLTTPSASIFENIKFASSSPDTTFRSLYQCEVIARDWAEKLSKNVGTGKSGDALVAHDLEISDFEDASLEFKRKYPNLSENGALIGIIYCDNTHPTEVERKLIRLLENYDSVTLAICGAPRTENFEQIEQFFTEKLPEHVSFISFPFDPSAEYNPYLGLIMTADHLVRRGISQSIDSEIFALGKSVHVLAGDDWENPLKSSGYYRNLSEYADDDILRTYLQEPINVTASLADELITQYLQSRNQFEISLQAVSF